MSQLSQVRSLCQDKGLFNIQAAYALTNALTFQLALWPVVTSTGVTFTPSAGQPLFTVDPENGLITWASAPTPGNVDIGYYHSLLSDETINDFLALEANNSIDPNNVVKLAAADALDAIAVNQALIQKKITMLDLQTDGPALAAALQKSASVLREQVFSQDMQEGAFDIIEEINDLPGYREKILKDIYRDS